MKYIEYNKKRRELIDKADKALNNDRNLKEAKKFFDEIEQLDEENKEKVNKYSDEFAQYMDAVEEANERALRGERSKNTNFNIENIMSGSEKITFDGYSRNMIGGENVKSVFLNKSDKLVDRVKISDEEKQLLNHDGALGNVVKGMVTGKWESQEFKNVVGTTATGTLIPQILSAKIIDKARELSLFTTAGVPIVKMDSNNMTISRVKTDPKFTFKEEGKTGLQAEFELDSVKLESKMAYGYAYVSLEAINSSQNLSSILHQVFAQAMANAIDKAFIYGQEITSNEIINDNNSNIETPTTSKAIYAPSGIMNDDNINTIEASTNGGYDDFIKAIGKVKRENGTPTVYGINSDTEQLLSLLKTTDGKYLEPPKVMEDMQRIVSNQLLHDDTKGNDALIFDPYALLIGIQNNIQIKIIEDQECLRKGLVGFQIYSMLDCKTTMPKHICKITGIK